MLAAARPLLHASLSFWRLLRSRPAKPASATLRLAAGPARSGTSALAAGAARPRSGNCSTSYVGGGILRFALRFRRE